jgi:Protein of unknown function (DUF1236)
LNLICSSKGIPNSLNCHYALAAAGSVLIVAAAGTALAEDIVIVPEQETAIREYVVLQKTRPMRVAPDVAIAVGSTLPDTVELYQIGVPGVTYRYFVVGKQTILVDPGTRRIVRILD